ncbi:hypothetical protein [Eleftheria terrae]|uniref:hypothetical protein n=1 Tax=Eleftheria terrae TaxID=1597781 RepID=UPI00263A8001|nr:hypothetical protein [Eleftheria terrae]WKB55561.1 hypothetical protein N7L95_26165 [Eleftheria terrae]
MQMSSRPPGTVPARALAWVVQAALCALVLEVSQPAAAQNWTALLKDTPAEQLSDDDVRLLREVARAVLNDPQDPVSGSWNNPVTRNRGQITAAKSFRWRDHPCRTLRMDFEVGGRKGSTSLSLCHIEGRWRAISASDVRDATAP